MNEKFLKKVNLFGKSSIILGIISIVVGVAVGTLTIVFGSNLLSIKKK